MERMFLKRCFEASKWILYFYYYSSTAPVNHPFLFCSVYFIQTKQKIWITEHCWIRDISLYKIAETLWTLSFLLWSFSSNFRLDICTSVLNNKITIPSRIWWLYDVYVLCYVVQCLTFSWISCVDCASQKATVATSFRMGISTVQSRPSSSATRGRGCMGPFMIGGLMPTNTNEKRESVRLAE